MTPLRGLCPDDDDNATHVLDWNECEEAAKQIQLRYPNTNNRVFYNPLPSIPKGCIAVCTWDKLDSGNCYDRNTTSLQITWNDNALVFDRGEYWRRICKSEGIEGTVL